MGSGVAWWGVNRSIQRSIRIDRSMRSSKSNRSIRLLLEIKLLSSVSAPIFQKYKYCRAFSATKEPKCTTVFIILFFLKKNRPEGLDLSFFLKKNKEIQILSSVSAPSGPKRSTILLRIINIVERFGPFGAETLDNLCSSLIKSSPSAPVFLRIINIAERFGPFGAETLDNICISSQIGPFGPDFVKNN